MIERNDEDLVRATVTGDRQSFAELVKKYQKPIFNLALRMSGNRADAQDIAQTAFIKAFEKLDSFKPNRHFFSWLYRIAINESINWLRRHKRIVPMENEQLPDTAPSEPRTSQAELAEMIQLALMRIKLDYRTVIILRHFQELSYEEVAHILDLSVETVKSRLFMARKMLKQVLLKMGFRYEK